MGKNVGIVWIYSIAHFIVDFACAFLMFRTILGSQHWYLGLLLYNFCAFALQMPFGLIADRWNRNAVVSAIGCGLIALSFLPLDYIILTVIILGIGNGLFHIGGGIEMLNLSKKSPVYLGIYVSPGALGLYLGTILGRQNIMNSLYVVVAVSIVMIIILIHSYIVRKGFTSDNEPMAFPGLNSPGVFVAILGLLLVVILRSYIGMTSSFGWKSDTLWSVFFLGAVILGKVFGGILAVPLGVTRISVVSLGLSAVFFLFSDVPILGVAAIFFFNMTMPLTLWAMARLLQGSKGFAFGLLTFGLFLGFMPSYLELTPLLSTTVGFSVASVLSMVLLLYGIHKVVD